MSPSLFIVTFTIGIVSITLTASASDSLNNISNSDILKSLASVDPAKPPPVDNSLGLGIIIFIILTLFSTNETIELL